MLVLNKYSWFSLFGNLMLLYQIEQKFIEGKTMIAFLWFSLIGICIAIFQTVQKFLAAKNATDKLVFSITLIFHGVILSWIIWLLTHART